ncbi:anti-sigma factor [Frankia sp. Cr1]|uniref:anti-sigma factor n=1 Tax=Frankia sp. Cr1 TaxID=3073931 RepID=UPI002AD3400D|nr:anti-sigma factor [Frankia sp. Cr1]
MDTTPKTGTANGQGGVPGGGAPGTGASTSTVPSSGVPGGGLRDIVQLTLPAASAYLSVLRTATASLAARADFTLDDIEDLRIAVDEACALLLLSAVPGSNLECTFELAPGVIQVAVTVLSLDGEPPSTDTFAWTVLTALADEVSSSVTADPRVTIRLRKRRGVPEDRVPEDRVPENRVPENRVPGPTTAETRATTTPWTGNAGAPSNGPVGAP